MDEKGVPLIMSGAVYQRVLNALTKRTPDYGVRDYDLGYFDASDISYEAEDAVIVLKRACTRRLEWPPFPWRCPCGSKEPKHARTDGIGVIL